MSEETASAKSGLMNALLKALGLLLGAVLFTAATLPLIEAAGALPTVSKLEVAGEFKRLDVAQVRVQLAPLLSGTLLSLDLDAVRDAADALPWVARARVERVWPDAVRVSLVERTPIARWNEHSLLADDGVLFTPSDKLQDNLPLLSGPKGQETSVIQTFRDLSAQVPAGDFSINTLSLNERGEWTAHTTTGLELRLGRGDPVAKASLITGAVTRALSARVAEISYVDLRYSNGFSVGWRASAAKGDAP